MADPASHPGLDRPPRRAGSTSLCWALSAIGLAMTSAATVFTFHLLHEPMEAVGEAVVDHVASAHCTAITRVLAGLSIASQNSLLAEQLRKGQAQTRASADNASIVGVFSPSSGTLETLHSSRLTPAQVLAVLRSLPLTAAPAPASVGVVPAGQSCPGFGYGLHPSEVRIQSIPSPIAAAEPAHNHEGHPHGQQPAEPSGGHAGGPTGARAPADQWTAFLYNPPQASGAQKTTFALVNLRELTERIGGHEHDLEAINSSHNSSLHLEIGTYPLAILRHPRSIRKALISIPKEDDHLAILRLIPFANQVIGTRVSVDHESITRTSTQGAGTVLLFGLLATASVVLVSRSAQIKLERLNHQLASESRTDSLTRVANRRAWDEALRTAESRRRRHGERYGLIVIDLDGFKQINDQQGHQCGDAVLQTTADLLRSELRASDLLARVGGDEFALLVHRPDPEGLVDLTTRLKTRLNQAGIQASMGGAICGAERTIEESWSQADQAMYLEKQL